MAAILGISIGTRNVGLAVIQRRRLTDFRIRTFAGKWTATKCESILNIVEAVIKRNGITDITLKVPKPSHRSENLEELIQGITSLAGRFHIEVHPCTRQDIHLLYGAMGKGKKKVLVAAIIEKYPELKRDWKKGKRAEAYNAKLFEAIASAELALRAGH